MQIKKLLGDDPRFRVVLASQVGYSPPGALLKMQLEYVEKYHGPPGISSTPSPVLRTSRRAGMKPIRRRKNGTRSARTSPSMASATGCWRHRDSANENVKAFHALAQKYGLKSFAYEGGLDLQQSPTISTSRSPGNTTAHGIAIEDYLNHWYAGGGDAMFYFTLSCKYSKNGYWGLTEDVRELLTPKYLAATRVSSKLKQTP